MRSRASTLCALSPCFVRYADDANVYVRSRRAGERVMALLRGLYGKLKLTINEAKSAVASVFGRKFLGYSLWVARSDAHDLRLVEASSTTRSSSDSAASPHSSGAPPLLASRSCLLGRQHENTLQSVLFLMSD